MTGTTSRPPRAQHTTGRGNPPSPRRAWVTRRGLEIALGGLWLLDAALQYQPAMFTRGFYDDLFDMANMGLPGPLGAVIDHTAGLVTAHPVGWNTTFASLQLVLGLGLLHPRTAPLARAASIPWALGIWILGEGFGGLGMAGTSLLTGAPGAALLYALLALILWPRPARHQHTRPGGDQRPAYPTDRGSVAGGGLLGARPARWCWTAIWTGIAVLELEPANHAAAVPAAQLTDVGQDEPRTVAAANAALGNLLGAHGLSFAAAVGAACLLIGWGVHLHRVQRAALLAGIALTTFGGVAGQDLGGLLSGHATDPGTAPPLILIAAALWPTAPRRNRQHPQQTQTWPSRSLAGHPRPTPALAAAPPTQAAARR